MNKPFSRKIETNGFKDLSLLDNYIQKCLDLYKTVNPLKEYYEISGKYSKYIINNKSIIPDLVIYNSKFNKNDCFYDYYGSSYNAFPRVKFILNPKKSKIQNIKKEEIKEVKNEEIIEEKNLKDELKKDEIIENQNDNKKANSNESNDEKTKEEKNNEEEKEEINDEEEDLTNPTQFLTQMQINQEKLTKDQNNINEMTKEIKEENKQEEENVDIKIEEKKKEIEQEEKKQMSKKNIILNPNSKNIIVEEGIESLTFIENKKPKNENNTLSNLSTTISDNNNNNNNNNNDNNNNNNNVNNNNNNNNNIVNNENNNEKPKIQMLPPQMNIPIMSPLMYMQNPLMSNSNLSVPFNYNIMNQINYMNFHNEDDEDEDNDPMLNNFNDDFTKYNPNIFLEKPALIVKKNLFDKNWILMRNNKVVSNYNSEQLLYYLASQIRLGNKFENMNICDYQTEIVFMPSHLFDILRNTVPKLKKNYLQQKMMEFNLNKQQMFMMNNQMLMNNKYSKFNSGNNK